MIRNFNDVRARSEIIMNERVECDLWFKLFQNNTTFTTKQSLF